MKNLCFALLAVLLLLGCRPAAPVASAPPASPSPPATPAPPTTASLQADYRNAALRLGPQLRETLAQPSTRDHMLAKAREAEVNYKKVMKIVARRLGDRYAPEPGETLVAVVLQRISTETPSLIEDKSDLLRRFKSVLRLHVKVDKPSTLPNPEGEGLFNYDIDIPVSADPAGAWSFPTTDEAVAVITKRCEGVADFYIDQEDEYLKVLDPDGNK